MWFDEEENDDSVEVFYCYDDMKVSMIIVMIVKIMKKKMYRSDFLKLFSFLFFA
jgi:hypothetical protein